MFASCPSELGGCSEEVQVDVNPVAGEISFDVSIVYIPGSSCGTNQNLTRIVLNRVSTDTSLFDSNLRPGENWTKSCCNVSLDHHGLDSGELGHQLVLTLFNATANDSGHYEIMIYGSHTNGNDETTLKKKFYVNILPGKETVTILP